MRYCAITDDGFAIVEAENIRQARRYINKRVGGSVFVQEVRRATDADLDYFRHLNGRVQQAASASSAGSAGIGGGDEL